jgi:poly(A) polymerase Pap1
VLRRCHHAQLGPVASSLILFHQRVLLSPSCFRCCRVVLVPLIVPRATVFELLPPLLQQYGGVTDITIVSDARVPLLKFTMSDLAVDIVPLSVDLPAPPEDAQLDDVMIFERVAAESRICLNGIRTAVAFRRLIQDGACTNLDTFSNTLRAIKSWARARHIYGHNYGYPSSVGYAVMLFATAQRHPRSNEHALFRHFLDDYAAWASTFPRLALVAANRDLNPYPQHYRRWAGLPDSFDADSTSMSPLVVLTPSYPYVNSCYTACSSAARCLAEELLRAKAYCESHICPTDPTPWRQLMVPPPDFLAGAAGVVFVLAAAGSPGGLAAVSGFAESKIRFLWYCCEAVGLDCRLYPGKFHSPFTHAPPPHAVMLVLRVAGFRTPSPTKDLDSVVRAAVEEFAFFAASVPPETAGSASDVLPLDCRYAPRDSATFRKVVKALAREPAPGLADESIGLMMKRHRTESAEAT